MRRHPTKPFAEIVKSVAEHPRGASTVGYPRGDTELFW